MIIQDCLLLELKSVDQLMPVHFLQTLSYIRLLNIKRGFLINFNTARFKD